MIEDEGEIEDKLDELNDVLERREGTISSLKESSELTELENHVSFAGETAFAIGTLWMELGELEEVREIFLKSAGYWRVLLYSTRAKYRRTTMSSYGFCAKYLQYAENAVVAAILAGDPRIQTAIYEEVNHLRPEDVPSPDKVPGHQRVRLLLGLVTDDDDLLAESCRALEDATETGEKDAALVDLGRGFLAGDPAAITAAIERLASLPEDFVNRSIWYGTEVMNAPAVAGLATARRRGFDVTVDVPAVPAAASELDWEPVEHDYPELIELLLADVRNHEFEELVEDDQDEDEDETEEPVYRIAARSETVDVDDPEYPDLPLYQGGLTGPGYNFAMSVAEALFQDDPALPVGSASLERSDLHVPVSHFAAVADRLWVGATPEGLYVGTPLRPEAYGFASLSQVDMARFDCDRPGVAVVDADALADAVETVAREGESWAKLSLNPDDDELVVRTTGSEDLISRTVEMGRPPTLAHDWEPGDAPFLYLLTDPTHREPPAFAWERFPTIGVEYDRHWAITDPFEGASGDPLAVRILLSREDDGSWVGGLNLDPDPEEGTPEPGTPIPGTVTTESEPNLSARWPFGAPDRRDSLLEETVRGLADGETPLEAGDAVLLAESTYDGGRLQSFVEGHPTEPRRYIHHYLLSLAPDDRLRIERQIRRAGHLVYEQAPLE
jgi:hypothetical protein